MESVTKWSVTYKMVNDLLIGLRRLFCLFGFCFCGGGVSQFFFFFFTDAD